MSQAGKSWVYFVGDDKCIRIGSSGDLPKRLAAHGKYGLKPLAMLPGSKEHEDRLHAFYSPYRLPDRDSSTYPHDVIYPYVERLLEFQYATDKPQKALTWSRVDYRLWNPERMASPMWDGDQRALFVTERIRVDERDCYETPEDVLVPCRVALNGIDLDPCSTSMANERVGAVNFYDEQRDGLSLPWLGTVFLNPPYSGGTKDAPMAALFIRKLISELDAGHTTAAITVLNLQSMPTQWFPDVWERATMHAIWKRRIDFIRPRTETGSKPYSSSKNGTIFSYFGNELERFLKAFRFHALVFEPCKTARAHKCSCPT